VAILGGVGIGYLVGGARSPRTGEQVVQPTPSAVSTPAPIVVPTVQHPRTVNGDYTAPGAPRIAIHEESAPVLRRVTPTPLTPSVDPEATQEAAPTPRPLQAPESTPPDGNTSGTAPDPDSSAGATPAANPDTSTAPPAPADPDFERVNKPADSEKGQEGGGKVLFRVQTGSYTDESHARSVADELRSKGYSSSTRSERDGDHVIYKVQVGAYRTKGGAGKAAEDLQKKGFPAYVSPISP
jgi:cell division septation protein DedD